MKITFALLVITAISVYAVRAFFTPSFIPTHDAEYHVVRLWQFDKNIKDGNLVPVWAPDLNYGYGVPIFAFFYPVPNYIGQFFHTLQFSFIDSVKLVLATSMILSGTSFFLWLKCFFSMRASLIGAVSFVLAPYHLVVITIRGSVGEAWALVFLPITLFLIKKIVSSKNVPFHLVGLLACSLSLLVLSHNVLGSIFFAFTVFYSVFESINTAKWKSLVIGYLLSLLLVSFFFVPLAFEKEYVTGLDIVNYKDHFVSFFQFVFPSWGSGFSVPGISDQLSFQLGLVHIAGLLLGLYIAIKKKNRLVGAIGIVTGITMFLMLENSLFVWEWFSLLRFMQFPWRLLAIVLVTTSFMVGYVAMVNPKLGYLLLILCLLYVPYTNTVRYQPREDNFFLDNDSWVYGTTTVGNSFNTRNFSLPLIDSGEFYISNGLGQISSGIRRSTRSQAVILLPKAGSVEVHRAFFPGWKGYVDNEPVPIASNQNGIIAMEVPEGIHSILVVFEGTVVRSVFLWISTVTFVGILYFSIHSIYENRNKHISA